MEKKSDLDFTCNWIKSTKDASIELEQKLGKLIYDALQGKVVEDVIRKTRMSGGDAYWRSNMEGHSLKVEKDLLNAFYDLCQEVKNTLGVEDSVDFYITGDSSVNAFSVASECDGEPHIVNINSALFDLMSEDELRFVIGHELGHLINKDTALARLIHFVFPPESNIPVTLQYKIRLHSQLAELVADRYGFLATRNLEACVTAFFKMASGLDLTKMNVSIDALLADNNRRLEYFLNDKGVSKASHPVNPVRVQALNLFSSAKNEEELQKGMDELISILLKVETSEIDEHFAHFIATAGLIVSGCDGDISKNEIEKVLEVLSRWKIFPQQFLDEIYNGNVGEIFSQSVTRILEYNPGMRNDMLGYMIHIILADKNIANEELELIYRFGNDIGFSEKEIAMAIGTEIQRSYVPSLDAIC